MINSPADTPSEVPPSDLGVHLHNAGRYSEGANAHAEAARVYEAAEHFQAAAGERGYQADSLLAAGQPRRALDAAETSLRMATTADDPLLMGEAYYLIARALFWLDQDAAALAACGKAQEQYARSPRDPGARTEALAEFTAKVETAVAEGGAKRADVIEAPPFGYIEGA